MVYVIAQLSDTHIGGPNNGSGERLSAAVDEINAMTRPPDLVLITGDLTHNGTPDEWAEFRRRLDESTSPWVAISGNHDRLIEELSGHRSIEAGPLRLVLLDTSGDEFTGQDAEWLEGELGAWPNHPTVVAIHQPPFETGIWWMDCVGLRGAELLEATVRRHPQVVKVLSGHVHRLIQSNWGSCSLWVCPSTSVTVAGDIDPAHEPSETAEGPAFSLHAFTGEAIVSHLVPVGPQAIRNPIAKHAPDFVRRVKAVQEDRDSLFK